MTPRKSEGRRGKKRSGLALASETRGRGRGGERERRIIENIFQRVLIRTCAAFDPRFCTFLPLDTLQLAVATRKKPMIQDQGEEEGGEGGRTKRVRSTCRPAEDVEEEVGEEEEEEAW